MAQTFALCAAIDYSKLYIGRAMLSMKTIRRESGLAMPIVMVVGAVGFLGVTTVAIVTSRGLLNSINSQQERQAREHAEAGMARTVEALNSDYKYLLINCYNNTSDQCKNIVYTDTNGDIKGTWSNPRSVLQCDASTGVDPLPASDLEQTISSSPNGSYKILSYVFDGTPFYGGQGTLTVEGSVLSEDSSRTLSRVVLQKTFNVASKNCEAGFEDPGTSSGFGGICAKDVNLGNNDVFGAISGNIRCTDCEYADPDNGTQEEALTLIDAGNNATVSGLVFIGGEPCPDIYPFPPTLLSNLLAAQGTTEDLQDYISKIPGQNKYQVIAGTAASTADGNINNSNMCITDQGNNTDPSSGLPLANGQPFTYCLVDNILLSNTEQLEVDTTNGPVKIYTLNDVDAGGQRSISQVVTGGTVEPTPFRLGLYGRSVAECQAARVIDEEFQQEAYFSGVSAVKGKGGKNGGSVEAKAANVFVHFPCGKVGINGGAGSSVDENDCNYEDSTVTVDNYLDPSYNPNGIPPYGDCGGGDVRGVVWAEVWDGSNSNQAQLVVPTNAPNDASDNNGEDYSAGVKDFVAIGTSVWTGFGRIISQ